MSDKCPQFKLSFVVTPIIRRFSSRERRWKCLLFLSPSSVASTVLIASFWHWSPTVALWDERLQRSSYAQVHGRMKAWKHGCKMWWMKSNAAAIRVWNEICHWDIYHCQMCMEMEKMENAIQKSLPTYGSVWIIPLSLVPLSRITSDALSLKRLLDTTR